MKAALDGLDAIPWARLPHAYGPAYDASGRLRPLASGNADAREQALADPFGNIWPQGTVYEATAPAAPFFVELAGTPAATGRAELLGWIGAARG